MKIQSMLAFGCALAAFGFTTALQAQDVTPPPPPKQEKDVYDTSAATEKLKTFTQMLDSAAVKENLKSKGEKDRGFTVFAPTDEAFAKLPKQVMDKLLADKKLLKEVILFHIVSGKSRVGEIPAGSTLKSLQGEPLTVKVEDGATWLNAAKVVTVDTNATNGYIHTVDTVLIPPSVAQKLGIGT